MDVADVGREQLLNELRWIASGKDATASAHDRVAAIRELLRSETPARPVSEVTTLRIIRQDDGTEQMVLEGDELADEASDAEVTSG